VLSEREALQDNTDASKGLQYGSMPGLLCFFTDRVSIFVQCGHWHKATAQSSAKLEMHASVCGLVKFIVYASLKRLRY